MDESAYTLQDQLFNPQEILMPKKHHNMTQDVEIQLNPLVGLEIGV